MFYNTIREFSEIVADYTVSEFRRYGAAMSFVAKVVFIDGSVLFIKDYLFIDGKRSIPSIGRMIPGAFYLGGIMHHIMMISFHFLITGTCITHKLRHQPKEPCRIFFILSAVH
jgi:hypothetical protein